MDLKGASYFSLLQGINLFFLLGINFFWPQSVGIFFTNYFLGKLFFAPPSITFLIVHP